MTGNVILADFRAARVFADKMNRKRDLAHHPERAAHASELNAMGLIDEVLHAIIEHYRRTTNPKVMEELEDWLAAGIGAEPLQSCLLAFVETFPPLTVYQKKTDARHYLASKSLGIPNAQITLEELLMLWLANNNPAFQRYAELFSDDKLQTETAYSAIIRNLQGFFEQQPGLGPGDTDLFSLLRQPALRSPDSLAGQLRFLLNTWGDILVDVKVRLLGGVDFITEESKAVFPGPGLTEVIRFDTVSEPGTDLELEQFSPDAHWMPRLILIAKSTLVWLDQLSRKYKQAISKLDQIPDEELDLLASWGFTGLWLIGVWERSGASKTIKHLCGNRDAEASAYSLFDYEIAAELGGDSALEHLRSRCMQRGLRLACDMVPNHTGIDSRWVREHPDWFVNAPDSPFPSYTFSGTDLCSDQRYGIYLEDKYYDRTDAAVVFKRVDQATGRSHYIYHGNDGTGMAWNDTAQLDYLKPEVRQAVTRKIVEVVKKFPIVRFDAAMTLAKKHFQRLWYPEPGAGGDIASRAEFGLSKADFDRHFPVEFWREVVDQVAEEVPDSLLLAEAFWFMEGYFVRTLGMHRVYNSAFMNMLKNEENEKYRRTVINTLQFDPEVLKRYVNFMNNPDEDTAIAQFGDHDKYFGVCVMMVTMPGLPMFGHGQIEGFREKYGMEFRRAYSDEEVNEGLLRRHELEIFPLIRKRYLFAEVENFLFYDFLLDGGTVNQNVFAYSNISGSERTLVLYHNSYGDTAGWLRFSVPFLDKSKGDDEKTLVQRSLRQGLALKDEESSFLVFRDCVTGLEYLRRCRDVCDNGLYFELQAYHYVVITEISEIRDTDDGRYAALCSQLDGRGVKSLSEEIRRLVMQPFLARLDELLADARLIELYEPTNKSIDSRHEPEHLSAQVKEIISAAPSTAAGDPPEQSRIDSAMAYFSASIALPDWCLIIAEHPEADKKSVDFLQDITTRVDWFIVRAWCIIHCLDPEFERGEKNRRTADWFDDLLLRERMAASLIAAGTNPELAAEHSELVGVLLAQRKWQDGLAETVDPRERLTELFRSEPVNTFTKVNRFEGTVWFNKERFDKMVVHLYLIALFDLMSVEPDTGDAKLPVTTVRQFNVLTGVVRDWRAAESKSEYKLTELLKLCAERLE